MKRKKIEESATYGKTNTEEDPIAKKIRYLENDCEAIMKRNTELQELNWNYQRKIQMYERILTDIKNSMSPILKAHNYTTVDINLD